MSRGVTTRAMATSDSASRSEESVKARHRGLRADRNESMSRQDLPSEMIPKSMILQTRWLFKKLVEET